MVGTNGFTTITQATIKCVYSVNVAWIKTWTTPEMSHRVLYSLFCGRGSVPQEGGGLGRAWTLQGRFGCVIQGVPKKTVPLFYFCDNFRRWTPILTIFSPLEPDVYDA